MPLRPEGANPEERSQPLLPRDGLITATAINIVPSRAERITRSPRKGPG